MDFIFSCKLNPNFRFKLDLYNRLIVPDTCLPGSGRQEAVVEGS